MYVRVARFEGGTSTDIETEGARIRHDVEASRRGEAGREIPSELTRLVDRVEMLVDRQRGSVALCVYCDTEDKLRAADRILNGMSPTSSGWGARVSVDSYEVAFDEVLSTYKAA